MSTSASPPAATCETISACAPRNDPYPKTSRSTTRARCSSPAVSRSSRTAPAARPSGTPEVSGQCVDDIHADGIDRVSAFHEIDRGQLQSRDSFADAQVMLAFELEGGNRITLVRVDAERDHEHFGAECRHSRTSALQS